MAPTNTKQLLKPLHVPWMVSPSTPFLVMHFSESGGDDGDFPSYVEFIAYNRLFKEELAEGTSGRYVQVVSPPPLGFFRSIDGESAGAYQLVRLQFSCASQARVLPSFSDSQVIEESAYDWSLVTGAWDGQEDIRDWLKRGNEDWRETGLSPNPGAYEVERSHWLQKSGPSTDDDQWHHYLVVGHDCYAEVIAQGIRIIYGQVLENW